MPSSEVDHTIRIRELNDLARKAPDFGKCRLIFTPGIAFMTEDDKTAVMKQVSEFNTFTTDDDPYGEHDFGAFTYNGERIFWKIDYYDDTLEFGSDAPWNPAVTTRVLTVMLAEEY